MQITYEKGDPVFAMIGDPVSHSISPTMHNTLFNRFNLPGIMLPVHVRRGEVGKLFAVAEWFNLKGLSITMPHKQQVMDFCDEIEPVAKLCSAVNCIAIRDGRVFGYNTDAVGLRRGVESAGFSYEGQDIMMLGAGAVTHPIAYEMARTAKSVTFLNRTHSKALEAAAFLNENTSCKGYAAEFTDENLHAVARKSTMLFNSTCIGMHGIDAQFEELSFIGELPKGSLVSDLIYNPLETKFLHEAKEMGYPILNGLPMLIYQGFITFSHFTGTMPGEADYKAVAEAIGF